MENQYPNCGERPDRIPEAKLQKKQKEKQRNLTVMLGIAIGCLMLTGFVLIFTPEDKKQPVQQTTDPYAHIYSYLANEQQTAATTAVQPSASGTLPVQTTVTQFTTQPPETTPTETTVLQTTAANTAADNGTQSLHVSLKADNPYIQIVNRSYGISVDLLTAVYVLPDSGQNYVMEWTGEKDAQGNLLRNSDTLRRCYLIDAAGKVTAVAAANASERENISKAENTLAMDTLIKKILIPAIEKSLTE